MNPPAGARACVPRSALRRDEPAMQERARAGLVHELLDTDQIEARYEDGVLFVRIPVAENTRPHKVEIQSEDRQAVEVGANT